MSLCIIIHTNSLLQVVLSFAQHIFHFGFAGFSSHLQIHSTQVVVSHPTIVLINGGFIDSFFLRKRRRKGSTVEQFLLGKSIHIYLSFRYLLRKNRNLCGSLFLFHSQYFRSGSTEFRVNFSENFVISRELVHLVFFFFKRTRAINDVIIFLLLSLSKTIVLLQHLAKS